MRTSVLAYVVVSKLPSRPSAVTPVKDQKTWLLQGVFFTVLLRVSGHRKVVVVVWFLWQISNLLIVPSKTWLQDGVISAPCSECQKLWNSNDAGKRREYLHSLKVAKCLVIYLRCHRG